MRINEQKEIKEKTMDELIERLEWVAGLDDVDHDICDIAREAIEAIEDLESRLDAIKFGL
jgi:hypothetical protein